MRAPVQQPFEEGDGSDAGAEVGQQQAAARTHGAEQLVDQVFTAAVVEQFGRPGRIHQVVAVESALARQQLFQAALAGRHPQRSVTAAYRFQAYAVVVEYQHLAVAPIAQFAGQFGFAEVTAGDAEHAGALAGLLAGFIQGAGDHPAPAAQGAGRLRAGGEVEDLVDALLGQVAQRVGLHAVQVVQQQGVAAAQAWAGQFSCGERQDIARWGCRFPGGRGLVEHETLALGLDARQFLTEFLLYLEGFPQLFRFADFFHRPPPMARRGLLDPSRGMQADIHSA
ncbi:hypothetical protein D3C76_1098070 [compost metagenome]